MTLAAEQKYLPALQELLPARDMKLKYGEPNADELRRHLDHLCLNRLLSRNYILSSNLRSVNTSHCWNHLCGRWAYKASTNTIPSLTNSNHTINTAPVTIVTPGGGGVSHHRRRASSNISNISHSSTSSTINTTICCINGDTVQQKNRVSRMKMCSRCCRAKYCSKLCQVYDWRSGRHKMECHFL
jgi:MYND finger